MFPQSSQQFFGTVLSGMFVCKFIQKVFPRKFFRKDFGKVFFGKIVWKVFTEGLYGILVWNVIIDNSSGKSFRKGVREAFLITFPDLFFEYVILNFF